MLAVILLAIAAAALSSYALIHAELERQAWDRVDHGARAGLALVEGETARLADLATLAAQRPTLRRLAASGEAGALHDYLETFRAGADLDQVVVTLPDRQVVAASSPTISGALVDRTDTPAIVALPGSDAGAAMVAGGQILDEAGRQDLGTVTVVRLLDTSFLDELGQVTGLEYSLLLGGDRVATTLPAYPAAASGNNSASPQRRFTAASQPFYAVTAAVAMAPPGLDL
ncbi:MAG TPA: cache domain-containing protein, partial [Anaerolineales bacterium]|nr:cache domain-containing protein [Anaerolineales bacterium]